MNRGLFKIENHVLVLDKEYLRGIPEFKVILERQYKVDGDADGRKKRYNYQLLYYVYMVADMFSYPNKEGLGEKDVHLAACKESKLPLDFKPDDEVKEAIAKYREIQIKTIPALATLNTIIRGLKTADTLSRRIILNIESKLEQLEIKKIQME
ncbi:MAG TPA: hypothetical protein PKI46_09630, partial [Bacteroidales bacterium]|nr:hypothetical protein [Bacteroidales bacterium]